MYSLSYPVIIAFSDKSKRRTLKITKKQCRSLAPYKLGYFYKVVAKLESKARYDFLFMAGFELKMPGTKRKRKILSQIGKYKII